MVFWTQWMLPTGSMFLLILKRSSFCKNWLGLGKQKEKCSANSEKRYADVLGKGYFIYWIFLFFYSFDFLFSAFFSFYYSWHLFGLRNFFVPFLRLSFMPNSALLGIYPTKWTRTVSASRTRPGWKLMKNVYVSRLASTDKLMCTDVREMNSTYCSDQNCE